MKEQDFNRNRTLVPLETHPSLASRDRDQRQFDEARLAGHVMAVEGSMDCPKCPELGVSFESSGVGLPVMPAWCGTGSMLVERKD
jgi:hypothetical protein